MADNNLQADDWQEIHDSDDWVEVPSQPNSLVKLINAVGTPVASAGKYLGGKALEGAAYLSDKADKYSGAPVRAAIGTAQNKGSLSDVVKSYINQIGEDRNKAPTGKQIAQKLGVPDTALSEVLPGFYNEAGSGYALKKGGALDPTASGVAGLGVDVAADPLTYVPIGKVAQGVGQIAKVAAPVGEAIGDIGRSAARKAMNIGLDIPESVSKLYMENPGAVNAAMDRHGISQKLADTLGQVRQDTGPLTQAAQATLSSERLPTHGLELNSALDALSKAPTPEARSFHQKLTSEYSQRIGDIAPEANAGFVTEAEMDQVRRSLQDAGSWQAALPPSKSAEVNQTAGVVSRYLKAQNPEYNSAMGELSGNIQAKQGLANRFGIVPDRTNPSGYTYSDRTMSALNDLHKENKVDRARVLDQLNGLEYGDLGKEVELSQANELLNGQGRPNGSRKAVMGGAIGGAVGHSTGVPGAAWVGAAVGSAAGGAADKYGPKIGKALMDLGSIIKQVSGTRGERFLGLLKQAEGKGPAAVATMHYLLQQSEPEYSAAITSEK